MLKSLIVIWIVIFSFSVSAQDGGGDSSDNQEAMVALQQSFVLSHVSLLNKEYLSLDISSQDYNQKRYEVLQKHLGPFQPVARRGGKLSLDPMGKAAFESLERIVDSLKDHKGETRKEIVKLMESLPEMKRFALSESFLKIHLAKVKTSPEFRIWKSTKAGVYHVGPEILRFATALALVRMTTCFGHNVFDMKGPAYWQASDSDPACIEEVGRMMVDPIFYAGFSAFIVGSRMGTAVINKTLLAMNPKYGISRGFVRTMLIPQLSMAIGFMADHGLKTLLTNEHIKACTKDTFSGKKRSDSQSLILSPELINQVLDGEVGEPVDASKSMSSNCKNAWRYLKSNQFLQEEIGMGVAGLVGTAFIMAGAQKVASLTRVGKALQGASLAIGATGVGGFVVGTGRLLVFLGLFEVLNHHVFSPFYLYAILEPQTDNSQSRLMRMYEDGANIKYQKVLTGFCSQDFSKAKAGEDDESFEKRKLIRQSSCPIDYALDSKSHSIEVEKSLSLYEAPICSKHHGAFRDGKSEGPLCSRIPMLADIESFSSYARLWRNKKILKDFNKAYGHWLLKLKSFFDNYFSSQEQVSQLSMSRELYLTGQSEYINLIRSKTESKIKQELSKKYPPQALSDVSNSIKEEAYAYGADSDYEGQVLSKLRAGEINSTGPDYVAFESYVYLYDLEYELSVNKDGDIFYGINGNRNVPTGAEVEKLLHKMVRLISDSKLQIKHHPGNKGADFYINMQKEDFMSAQITESLATNPFQTDLLLNYLTSSNQNTVGRGLIIWKEMRYFMYGPYPICNDSRPEQNRPPNCNSRGMKDSDFQVYSEINEALEHFDPLFAGDAFHERGLRGQYYEILNEENEEYSHLDSSKESTQHSKNYKGISTKKIGEYALANLICGMREGLFNQWFGDNDGFGLEFKFPHLRHDDICVELFYPIYGSRMPSPLPTHSLFVAPNDKIYFGLQNSYIMAPKNYDHPLVFSKQKDAEIWWNSKIKPDFINRLKNMKAPYYKNVVEKYFASAIGDLGSGQESWLTKQIKNGARWLPWASSSEEQVDDRLITTEGLAESYRNELHQYYRVAKKILSESEYNGFEALRKPLNECIGKILISIPEKNYRAAQESCEGTLDKVKRELNIENLSANEITEYKIIDDKKIADSLNSDGLIRAKLRFVIGDRVKGIFSEMDELNQMINESFDFELVEGESQ